MTVQSESLVKVKATSGRMLDRRHYKQVFGHVDRVDEVGMLLFDWAGYLQYAFAKQNDKYTSSRSYTVVVTIQHNMRTRRQPAPSLYLL
jgi:hypothetical protein